MRHKIVIALFIVIAVSATLYPQQNDSTYNYSKNNETYIPLSQVFSRINMEHDKLLSADSAYNKLPAKEKSLFSGDYLYIAGTAAIAAIIYFLWPEDNAAVQKKFTFGTPPPPDNR